MPKSLSTSPKKVFRRDFSLMVIGQIISLFGNAILRFSLSVCVLDMTGSAGAFAGISALSMVPTILLSPVGGVLADRVSRKRIMAALDFVTAAMLIAFTFFFQSTPSVALIGAAMVILSIIQSFYQPSVQASIPSLVEQEGLMTANGTVAQVNALANLLGPILGGVLYGVVGLFPVLYVSIVCFFFSAVMECFLRIPFIRQEKRGGAFRTVVTDFSEALHFLSKEREGLLQLLFLVAGINLFFSAMVIVGLPYLIKIFLGLSSQMYGLAQGAMGVGSILGGIFAGVVAKKMKFSNSHVLLLVTGIMTLPMGLSVITGQWPWASFGIILVSVTAMMCCTTLFSVYAQTILQKLTPTGLLGKVSSFIMVICMCALPLGQALYGVLFDWTQSYAFTIVLLAGAVSILLAVFSRKMLKKFADLDGGEDLTAQNSVIET